MGMIIKVKTATLDTCYKNDKEHKYMKKNICLKFSTSICILLTLIACNDKSTAPASEDSSATLSETSSSLTQSSSSQISSSPYPQIEIRWNETNLIDTSVVYDLYEHATIPYKVTAGEAAMDSIIGYRDGKRIYSWALNLAPGETHYSSYGQSFIDSGTFHFTIEVKDQNNNRDSIHFTFISTKIGKDLDISRSARFSWNHPDHDYPNCFSSTNKENLNIDLVTAYDSVYSKDVDFIFYAYKDLILASPDAFPDSIHESVSTWSTRKKTLFITLPEDAIKFTAIGFEDHPSKDYPPHSDALLARLSFDNGVSNISVRKNDVVAFKTQEGIIGAIRVRDRDNFSYAGFIDGDIIIMDQLMN